MHKTLTAFLLLTLSCNAQDIPLNWENLSGDTFEGIYRDQHEGKPIIERVEDDQKFLVPLNRFTQRSRDRVLVYMNEDPFAEKIKTEGENLIDNPEFQDRGSEWEFDVEGASFDYVSASSIQIGDEPSEPDDIILSVERNPNAMIIDYSEVYQSIPIDNTNVLLVVTLTIAYEGIDFGASDHFALRVSGDDLYRVWDPSEDEPEASFPTLYAEAPSRNAWHEVQFLVDLSPLSLDADSVKVHVATKVTSGTFYIRSIKAYVQPY